MSELQISLLVIGFTAVLGVYAFSGWQQRKYRRKIAEDLKFFETREPEGAVA